MSVLNESESVISRQKPVAPIDGHFWVANNPELGDDTALAGTVRMQ